MPIDVSCQSCGKRYRVAEKFTGKRVRCKNCGQPMLVPAAPEFVPAPPLGAGGGLDPEDSLAELSKLGDTGAPRMAVQSERSDDPFAQVDTGVEVNRQPLSLGEQFTAALNRGRSQPGR